MAEEEEREKCCLCRYSSVCVDRGSGEIKLLSSLLPPLHPVYFLQHSISALTLFFSKMRNDTRGIRGESTEEATLRIILEKKAMR